MAKSKSKVKITETPEVPLTIPPSRQREMKATFSFIVPNTDNETSISTKYNAKGKQDPNVTDILCPAIEVRIDRKITYKVKMDSGNHLFDPKNISFGYGLDKVDRHTKLPLFKFRQVNESCFKTYLNYLSKGNVSLLNEAERIAR